MQFLAVLALAVGLAMDATAVAATKGFSSPRLSFGHALRMALLFGAFQAGMPLLGWAIGSRFARLIEAWDHWVAFALLAFIGGKMLVDALRGGAEPSAERDDTPSLGALTLLAIATSIDALVAGLTLPLLGFPIFGAVLTIGVTTAVLSLLGVYLGRAFGGRIGRRLDVFGGLVLIALGTKVLLEGLAGG